MKKGNGFTLIEVLVYLALFGVVFSGLLVSAFAVIENIGRNDTQIMVQEEGDFLLAKIERAADPEVFKEEGGFLKINEIPLNNSNARVVNLRFINSDSGGLIKASFTLTAKTAQGKDYSRDFLTVYSLRE